MKGKIYKSTGSWYKIKAENQQFYQGRIRGILKLENYPENNPATVGDNIEFDIENEEPEIVNISKIYNRHNCIARLSIQNKNQQQTIAANIDQSILLVSIKSPATPQGLIDRFLITNELFHIKPLIVFNKSDIYNEENQQEFLFYKDMYRSIGYEVYLLSLETLQGFETIKNLLDNKITLLSGQSGSGKTSFINKLLNQNLNTQSVNVQSGKGMHTTTFSEIYDINSTTSIIDTPGIKELGLVNVEKIELSQYFPEMRSVLSDCKFNNCQHIYEPNCAIKQAVSELKIHIKRYESYLFIYSTF